MDARATAGLETGATPRSLLPIPCTPHSACREMFSKIPTLASVQNSDVPPCEIIGRGMPLLGTSESTTLMLKKACYRIDVVMPKATSRAKGSVQRKAVRSPRAPNIANKITIDMAPMNPSSSAMLAKMKSVAASGR